MKYYILASVIIFGFVIHHAIRKSNKESKSREEMFWEREEEANSVRKKGIENLPYITIPFEKLPMELLSDQPDIAACLETLHHLSGQKILNLTGYTNTDLKLTYGTANITALSAYDQNYTLLARTLQKWADLLWQKGYEKDACTIMEYALTTYTDISSTYYRLAEYYKAHNENEKIDGLILMASALSSPQGERIARTLTESYQ